MDHPPLSFSRINCYVSTHTLIQQANLLWINPHCHSTGQTVMYQPPLLFSRPNCYGSSPIVIQQDKLLCINPRCHSADQSVMYQPTLSFSRPICCGSANTVIQQAKPLPFSRPRCWDVAIVTNVTSTLKGTNCGRFKISWF